jgi:hypothetical protein
MYQGNASGRSQAAVLTILSISVAINLSQASSTLADDVSALVRSFTAQGSVGQNLFVGRSGNARMSPNGGSPVLASYNVAVGEKAFLNNSTGYQNVAVGYTALFSNSTGQGNVAVGLQALRGNTSGNHNIALGAASMMSNTTGNYNVGIAADALRFNTTGSYNMAMGYDALHSTETGSGNVSLGYLSMYANESGSGNVAIGFRAGFTATPNVSGHGNVWIGTDSGPSTDTPLNNAIAIGDLASNSESDQVVLGNEAVRNTVLRGAVAAGTSVLVGPAGLHSAPAGQHDFITLNDVDFVGATAVTDAAAFAFDADPGVHKAVDAGTTKPDIADVTAWIKVNLNGTVGYIPIYAAK